MILAAVQNQILLIYKNFLLQRKFLTNLNSLMSADTNKAVVFNLNRSKL